MVVTCHQSLPWLFVVLLLLSQSSFTNTLRWSHTHLKNADHRCIPLSTFTSLTFQSLSPSPIFTSSFLDALFFLLPLYIKLSLQGASIRSATVFPWWSTFGCDTVRLERHLVETVRTLQAVLTINRFKPHPPAVASTDPVYVFH